MIAALALLVVPQVIAEDGAWCWFSDPRAISAGGHTFVSWINSKGDVQVGEVDGIFRTLNRSLEVDDHDNPSLHALPDGRITAFYSKHGGPALLSRTTVSPYDISDWEDEKVIAPQPAGHSYTYPNPSYLADEKRLYLTWRGIDWKPTLSWSDDSGKTWSPALKMFAAPGASGSNRPYLKSATDGRRRIHFALTDGHPRNESANSIYYCYLEAGQFFKASGQAIGSLKDMPISPHLMDQVYDGSGPQGRSWIWDIALDSSGKPVITYGIYPREAEHRYAYSAWTGFEWKTSRLPQRSTWFPETSLGTKEREPHYSGGVVLDPKDPRYIYLSAPLGTGSRNEIIQGFTRDLGKSWDFAPITRGSKVHQIRPFVLRGGEKPWLFWMSNDGGYLHYTDYNSSIRGLSLVQFRREPVHR